MSAARVQALEGLLDRVRARKDGPKTRLMVARGAAAEAVEEVEPVSAADIEEVSVSEVEVEELSVSEVEVEELEAAEMEVAEEVVVEVDETPAPPEVSPKVEEPPKEEAPKPAATSPKAEAPKPVAKPEPPKPDVVPEPLPAAEPPSDARATLASRDAVAAAPTEVRLDAPAAPAPAESLASSVAPVTVEPTLLKRDDVGDFIGEVGKTEDATFGAILDATLDLTL